MAVRPCPVSWRLCWLPGLLVLAGCGGGGPSAATADDARDDEGSGRRSGAGAGDGMEAMGEVGALDRAEVEKVFGRAMADVDRCLADGRKRIRSLSGEIAVFLRVDRNGRAVSADLRRSTLGDRDATSCILDVYRKQQWPRPMGGKLGEIEHSHSFGVSDADPPESWSFERLGQAMAAEGGGEAAESPVDALREQLQRCKTEAGVPTLDITFYLDEEGFVPTVGVCTGNAKEASAYDCVSMVLKTTSFPSPGQNPAKVTVSL